MRYSIYKRGGYGHGSISTTGGEVFGPVVANRAPEELLEAGTKKYADDSVSNIHSSAFVEGIMPVSVTPEFKGEVYKAEGSGEVYLTETGVNAGTYTKVTVDEKGRVTAGTVLGANDMPLVPFSIFKEDSLPTTLAGYGITNALNRAGGILTGKIQVPEMGNTPLSLINKKYIDIDLPIEMQSAVSPGTVIYRPTDAPTEGYLRCNGALVEKNSYPGLFNTIGNTYNNNSFIGAGKPWQNQYGFNDTTSDMGVWVESSKKLPTGVSFGSAIVTRNKVYYIGGRNEFGSPSNKVYTCTLESDGSLGTWIEDPNSLPGALSNSQVVSTKNRVYVLGGFNGSGSSNVVYTATIANDGSLNAWSIAGTLPEGLMDSQAIVTKSRVYLIGGTAVAPTSNMYSATVNLDGTLGTWSTHSGVLPIAVSEANVVVTRNQVYLFSGRTVTGYSFGIYKAPISTEGVIGTWVTNPTNFYGNRLGGQVVVNDSKVWFIGGEYMFFNYAEEQYVRALDNLLIGGEITTTGEIRKLNGHRLQLPTPVKGGSLVTVKNKLHLIGGIALDAGQEETLQSTFTCLMPGGQNDLTGYYNGSIQDILNSQFQLPDIAPIDGLYSFIRI